jgi:hypothetical protein
MGNKYAHIAQLLNKCRYEQIIIKFRIILGSKLTHNERWLCVKTVMLFVMTVRCPLTAIVTFTSNKKT